MRTLGLAIWLALASVGDARDRVLVLCRQDDPSSQALARHYAEVRAIPEEAILSLPCPAAEAVDRATFDITIREPVKTVLQQRGWLRQPETQTTRGDCDPARRAAANRR